MAASAARIRTGAVDQSGLAVGAQPSRPRLARPTARDGSRGNVSARTGRRARLRIGPHQPRGAAVARAAPRRCRSGISPDSPRPSRPPARTEQSRPAPARSRQAKGRGSGVPARARHRRERAGNAQQPWQCAESARARARSHCRVSSGARAAARLLDRAREPRGCSKAWKARTRSIRSTAKP